jgi:hypothetical protein
MNQQHLRFDLSVLLFQQDGQMVAQCLQYDISGSGAGFDSAMKAFQCAFVGHVLFDLRDGKKPLESVPQAPEQFWQRFQNGKRLQERFPLRLPNSETLPSELRSATPQPWMIDAMAEASLAC